MVVDDRKDDDSYDLIKNRALACSRIPKTVHIYAFSILDYAYRQR